MVVLDESDNNTDGLVVFNFHFVSISLDEDRDIHQMML